MLKKMITSMAARKMKRTCFEESFLLKILPIMPPRMPQMHMRMSIKTLKFGTERVISVDRRLANWDKKMTAREFCAASFVFIE